jgi:ABC-type polysaccharide/polyol phosphate export permease
VPIRLTILFLPVPMLLLTFSPWRGLTISTLAVFYPDSRDVQYRYRRLDVPDAIIYPAEISGYRF